MVPIGNNIMETWFKFWCKKCNAVNWLYDYYDIDGFICHKCKESNFLIEDEHLRKMGVGDNPDNFGIGEEWPD